VSKFGFSIPENQRPRLAILPYPRRYTWPFLLKSGTPVTIRPIRSEDEPLLVKMFDNFSERTIRMRFFSMVRKLTHEALIRLCHLDYNREMALVAMYKDDQGDQQMLGVSRYYLDPESGTAEFAVTVADPWQRQGLGLHLMERLIEVARLRGVKRLEGVVLGENDVMLHFVKKLNFQVETGPDPSTLTAAFNL